MTFVDPLERMDEFSLPPMEPKALPGVTSVVVETRREMFPRLRRIMAWHRRWFKFGLEVFVGMEDIGVPGVCFLKVDVPMDRVIYTDFCIGYLVRCFDTSHALVWQWDGFVMNPAQWSDEFLGWDFIGAPIPRHKWWNIEGAIYPAVGNGGFSMRSHRFMDLASGLPRTCVVWDEDWFLCLEQRRAMEAKGMRYAPAELAARFSVVEVGGKLSDQFGFHDAAFLAGVKERLESRWIGRREQ